MGCISNDEYVTAAQQQADAMVSQAQAEAAIQVGLALWQRNSSKSIKNMQIEIANRQMILAEQVQAHAVLYWPKEKQLVDDTFGVAKVATQYVALTNEYGGLLQGAMTQGRTRWIDTMRSWCMDPTRCEDARWQRNTQLAQSDIMSYAARQDESRTQIVNDRRFARQYAVLQLGRGQLGDLLNYQSIGQASGLHAGELLMNSINSALTGFGYYPNRQYDQTGWGSGIRDAFGASTNGPTAPPMAISVSQVSQAPQPIFPGVPQWRDNAAKNATPEPKLGDALELFSKSKDDGGSI